MAQSLTETTNKPIHRVSWIDYAKGIGIFLVVLGHTLRGLASRNIISNQGWFGFTDQWIYAFHMALFFFLSGLFIDRAVSKPWPEFLKRQLQVIIYPYLIWSLLQGILQALINTDQKPIETILNLWRIIYEPIMQFWFFYVLFIMSVLYAITVKLAFPVRVFLAISIGLYLAHIYNFDFGPWGVLYQLRMYLIYFALGIAFRQTNWLSLGQKFNPLILLAITILGWLGVALAVILQLTEVNSFKPLIAVSGMGGAIALSYLLAQLNLLKFIENWGRLSLQIYVVHTMATAILRTILQKLLPINEPITHIILGTLIGIYASIGLAWLSQKYQFPYLFTLRKSSN